MLKSKTDIKNKISHRMKYHFSHIRSIFNDIVLTRTNSKSGLEGRFSLIYKMFFNENSYIGFRLKEDDISSMDQCIQFYVVRFLEKSNYRGIPSRKIVSVSKELSVCEFFDIMKSILSIETKESFVRILNEKEIFCFDLNCCLLNLSDFTKSFMNNEMIKEQFKIINEIEVKNNLTLENVEENMSKVNELLANDQEYQELIKQRKIIEDKIKEKELNATQCNNEKKVAEKVKELIEYFNSSFKRIDKTGHSEISKYVNTLHLIKEMGERLNKLNLHEKKIHTFEDDVILKNEMSFEMFIPNKD